MSGGGHLGPPDATHTLPLLRDIERLTGTLAEVLKAHGGEALYALVESMERAAKSARDATDTGEREAARGLLSDTVRALDPATALEVVRAFTLHFQLVNQAEDVHRTRELRRREIDGGPEAVTESLPAVITELARRGATREQVLESLRDVHLRFVFTAHPTEARRRTTERLLVAVREVLEDHDRRVLTPTERRVRDRRLRATVEALWEHAPERPRRPEVIDEVKTGLWYLRHVLMDVVPRMHRRLQHALKSCYGPVDPMELPVPADFGSWMGGDRDGNPFVTEAVTENTLRLHRWITLDRYAADLERLVDPLALMVERVPGRNVAFERALERASAVVPDKVVEFVRRNPDEPLRRFLSFMRERIHRTRDPGPGGYVDAAEFLEDLSAVRDLLLSARAVALADDALLDLILRVRTFGFSLAALDLREDARVHRRALADLLGDPKYPDRSDADRRGKLAALSLPADPDALAEETRRLLRSFESIGRMQKRYGVAALGTYIISMTSSAADVFEVLRLAELHGVGDSLDVVPLLETPDALRDASGILESLFADPHYRAHVERRGNVQEIVLGYSDSSKLMGMLASRAILRETQAAVAEVCRRHGVTLVLFHGRGGSVSRGGGPTYRAIRALPREAFSGRMKLTEQGETRAFNFASPDLAVRYLERTVGAALIARYEARFAPPPPPANEQRLLESLSRDSFEAYRELVSDPGLIRYFEETTPFHSISALTIGSRPVRRPAGIKTKRPLALEDLRAIPWVFAWSQSRLVLTGWYGVGRALEAFAATRRGMSLLERAYRESPFLLDLLDNVQMMLAKADLSIAERYAGLCTDPELRARIFGKVREEHERTGRCFLRISRQSELLDDDPVLQRSIRIRNPYVDPLSYIQVEALRRGRDPEHPEQAAWERVARAAVQGIAAGLRNTG